MAARSGKVILTELSPTEIAPCHLDYFHFYQEWFSQFMNWAFKFFNLRYVTYSRYVCCRMLICVLIRIVRPHAR